MLNWLRGKMSAPQSELSVLLHLLTLDDLGFVDAVKSMVFGLDPNSVTMLIVAFYNVTPIFEAGRQVFLTDPKEARKQKHDLTTMEGFLAALCENYDREHAEVGKRRLAWFAQGLLLRRADKLAKANPLCHDTLAEIWIYIAQNSTAFRDALERNILWSDDDLIWFGDESDKFSNVKDSRKALELCARIAPDYLRKTSRMKSFLKENGMSYILLPYGNPE